MSTTNINRWQNNEVNNDKKHGTNEVLEFTIATNNQKHRSCGVRITSTFGYTLDPALYPNPLPSSQFNISTTLLFSKQPPSSVPRTSSSSSSTTNLPCSSPYSFSLALYSSSTHTIVSIRRVYDASFTLLTTP